MELDEKLKIRFGFGLTEAAKRFGIRPAYFIKHLEQKPIMMEYALKGLEIGSKWSDFQVNLESKGFIIISKDGGVSYDKQTEGLSRLCTKSGLESTAFIVRRTEISKESLKQWYKKETPILQYLIFGLAWHVKFKHIEEALNETVFKD